MLRNRTILKLSSTLQIVLLLWLTISTPFVYAAQQAKADISTNLPASDDNTNPLSGTQEEKHSSSVGFNEEFLHTYEELHIADNLKIVVDYTNENAYRAFHGEPHCPPPNFC